MSWEPLRVCGSASEAGFHRVPMAAAWRAGRGAAVRSRVRILLAWPNVVAGSAGFMGYLKGRGQQDLLMDLVWGVNVGEGPQLPGTPV